MYDASLLLDLQALDRSISDLKEDLSATESSLQDKSAVIKAEDIFRRILEGHEKVAKEQRETERETQRLKDRKDLLESRIYSGDISNPKELSAIEEEIGNLNNLIYEQEDILLAQMEETEKYADGLKKATTQLEDAKSAHDQKVITLNSKKKELINKLNAEEPAQKTARGKFSVQVLQIYDRASKSNKGIPVAIVEADRCSECRIAIPNKLLEDLKTAEEFIFCNSCRRILLKDPER